MTQKTAVIEYMKRHGSITPMEAFSYLGITKLATVVSELIREDGMNIRKTPLKTETRYGRKTTYMQYSLGEENVGS